MSGLAASSRKESLMPTKIFRYTVEGLGAFPTDMLRYDQSWPAEETPLPLSLPVMGRWTVRLRGLRSPSLGRWDSFLCKVTEIDGKKVGI